MSEEVEMGQCTRCEMEVEEDTLVTFGGWRLCEICMGDI